MAAHPDASAPGTWAFRCAVAVHGQAGSSTLVLCLLTLADWQGSILAPRRYCSRVISAFPSGRLCLLPLTYAIGCTSAGSVRILASRALPIYRTSAPPRPRIIFFHTTVSQQRAVSGWGSTGRRAGKLSSEHVKPNSARDGRVCPMLELPCMLIVMKHDHQASRPGACRL